MSASADDAPVSSATASAPAPGGRASARAPAAARPATQTTTTAAVAAAPAAPKAKATRRKAGAAGEAAAAAATTTALVTPAGEDGAAAPAAAAAAAKTKKTRAPSAKSKSKQAAAAADPAAAASAPTRPLSGVAAATTTGAAEAAAAPLPLPAGDDLQLGPRPDAAPAAPATPAQARKPKARARGSGTAADTAATGPTPKRARASAGTASGKGKGRAAAAAGSATSPGGLSHVVKVEFAPEDVCADGSVRIGSVLYVPATFAVVGAKFSGGARQARAQILAAAKDARARMRACARRGGIKPSLPGLDYADVLVPYEAELTSSSSSEAPDDSDAEGKATAGKQRRVNKTPAKRKSAAGTAAAAAGGAASDAAGAAAAPATPARRGGKKRAASGAKAASAGTYAEWSDDDLFEAAIAAADAADAGKGSDASATSSDGERKDGDAAATPSSGPKKRGRSAATPKVPGSAPKTKQSRASSAAKNAEGKAAEGTAAEGKSAEGKAAAKAAKRASKSFVVQDPVPAFSPTQPRSSLFNFHRHTLLRMESLPASYQAAALEDVVKGIARWQARFSINNERLAGELGCSGSTVYFLMTNSYKFDMFNYNIRLRHYLWRIDQWAVGRATQGSELPPPPSVVPGTADDAAAATPEAAAAAAASSAATAAADASPAAAAAFPFAAELDAALAGPSSAELLASAGLSDWSAWLDFSLAPLERIPFDEALWPRVVAIERAVCNDPWRYQPRLPGSKRKYEFSGSSRKKRKNDEQAEELDEGDAAAEGGEGAAEATKTKRRRKLKVEAGAKEGETPADAATPARKTRKVTRKSYKEDDATSSDSDAAMSEGSDARGDMSDGSDGEEGGGGGGGSARRVGSAGRGRTRFPFEGSTCLYPMRRPQGTLLRHSSRLAHAAFAHPRWHFGPHQSGESTLQLADARDLLRAHIGVPEGAALPDLHFSSNQREFDLAPLGALAAHAVHHAIDENAPMEEEKKGEEPAAAPVDPAADLALLAAKSGGFGPDAVHPPVPPADSFAYVGTAVSSMSWCPAGDETHSPLASTQYLAVALHQPHQYVQLSSGALADHSGLLLVYGCELLDKTGAPRLRLALRHAHGGCVSMRFYPHSLETFAADAAETGAAAPLQRMGVLVAIFVDGSVEVRSVPKPPSLVAAATIADAAAAAAAAQVYTCSLDSLPGVCFHASSGAALPPAAAAAAAAPGHAPMAMALSNGRDACLVAVSSSGGTVSVFDLDEYTRTDDSMAITIRPSFGSIVSGLSFHPAQSHLLGACTLDGRIFVFDLRRPSAPVVSITTSVNSYRSLHWPAVSHPALECLLAAQVGGVRMVPLSRHSPTSEANKTVCTAEYFPAVSVPTHSQAVIAEFAVGERRDPSDPLVMVTANSDGSCAAFADNLDRLGVYCHRSAGVSASRWLPASASSGSGGDGGDGAFILDVSDSFAPVDTRIRANGVRAARTRELAERDGSAAPTAAQLAVDRSLPLTAVSVNPNVTFPRVIASAGLAGLVRLQTIHYM